MPRIDVQLANPGRIPLRRRRRNRADVGMVLPVDWGTERRPAVLVGIVRVRERTQLLAHPGGIRKLIELRGLQRARQSDVCRRPTRRQRLDAGLTRVDVPVPEPVQDLGFELADERLEVALLSRRELPAVVHRQLGAIADVLERPRHRDVASPTASIPVAVSAVAVPAIAAPRIRVRFLPEAREPPRLERRDNARVIRRPRVESTRRDQSRHAFRRVLAELELRRGTGPDDLRVRPRPAVHRIRQLGRWRRWRLDRERRQRRLSVRRQRHALPLLDDDETTPRSEFPLGVTRHRTEQPRERRPVELDHREVVRLEVTRLRLRLHPHDLSPVQPDDVTRPVHVDIQ